MELKVWPCYTRIDMFISRLIPNSVNRYTKIELILEYAFTQYQHSVEYSL